MFFFPLTRASQALSFEAPESGFGSCGSRAPCFFRLGPPVPLESTNGPDQVWMGSLEYVNEVELKGTSAGTKAGSM